MVLKVTETKLYQVPDDPATQEEVRKVLRRLRAAELQKDSPAVGRALNTLDDYLIDFSDLGGVVTETAVELQE